MCVYVAFYTTIDMARGSVYVCACMHACVCACVPVGVWVYLSV